MTPQYNPYHEPDTFSGTPYNLLDMGDASIPTLIGNNWYNLPQIINLGSKFVSAGNFKNIKGYDGIYLCAPEGTLYLYSGSGDKQPYANDKKSLQAFQKTPIKSDFPKSSVQWNDETNTSKPGYWDYTTGKFIT